MTTDHYVDVNLDDSGNATLSIKKTSDDSEEGTDLLQTIENILY